MYETKTVRAGEDDLDVKESKKQDGDKVEDRNLYC
jgi:hypothetical protein